MNYLDLLVGSSTSTSFTAVSVVVGCCQFLMLIKTICQLPSTTQTRNMSENQTVILLGMKNS